MELLVSGEGRGLDIFLFLVFDSVSVSEDERGSTMSVEPSSNLNNESETSTTHPTLSTRPRRPGETTSKR